LNRVSTRRWWTPLAIVAALAAALPLAAHAYVGTFARYIADDFCTASSLRRLGFLASQAYWFETWSGRYSYTFVVSLTQAVGPSLTPWLPVFILLAWVAAMVYAARRWLGGGGLLPAVLALATVHAFTTLEGSPSVYQSLYWQTGMITYTLPLVLSVVYAAWLWQDAVGSERPRNLPLACAISLGSAFLLGGFSETYAALQTAALTLLLFSLPFGIPQARRSRTAWLVGAGLVGSLLAALTIATAPGTLLRQALMPAAPDLLPWTEATLQDGYLFLARTVNESPQLIVLAIVVPCLLVMMRGLKDPDASPAKNGVRASILLPLVLLPILTPILMLATIAPYEYAVSSYPDARVLVTTMFVLITALVIWGACLGRLLAGLPRMRSGPADIGVLILAVLVAIGLLAASIQATRAILGGADVGRDYARSWDIRDEKLRVSGAAHADQVAAVSLRHMGGLAEIGRDPDEWINRCVAGTYAVGSVVAK